ncbi:kinase-like domain-containing protein [Russula earlei]|uniref:Kinase-like domain-containing protein n=1 Tax=Russula earlei TaxID=71964 RepID=A0ACC0TZM2_9AGAM|nr:kinase-like domain-containing protein [Russula earlei]
MLIHDFYMIRLLGHGSSGTVHLVREKSSGRLYALKSMPKHDGQSVKRNDAEQSALLLFRDDDRVIRFYASFDDSANFYIATEYFPAGDLFSLIYTCDDFSRKDAKLYAAELLLAIEAVHERGVIHRDLKPENIMIAMDGHLVLADFGLAWRLEKGRDFPESRVGTPEYSAPEVLLEKPYGLEADLWSFGVILYEMLSRQLPFQVFLNAPRNDRRWIKLQTQRVVTSDPEFRSCNFSADAKDILQKLLAKQFRKRLVSIGKIKLHHFFSTLDWQIMLARSHRPPWRPYFVPCEAEHLPPPLPPFRPQDNIPSVTEDNPGRNISACATPCSNIGAGDEYSSPLIKVGWDQVGACEACLRLCQFGRNNPVIDGRSKRLKGWMRCFRNHG